jgi:NADPH:quinone reductase-like Zn-dependent oxidoreductase
MRALVFTGAGGPEVMRLEERPDPIPGKGEVLVEQPFGGLNPADLLQRAGHYPAPPGSPPDIPGLEVAGRVVSNGDGATDFAPGDRVFGLVGGGGLADRVCVPLRHLAPVPDSLTDEQAASAPEAFITAHDAVMVQCGLRSGERLLVNGASGGVGTAAVQLGVASGARVIGTVRHEAAREWLRKAGAEPAVLAELQDAADVIIELVGAPHMDANLDAAALRGRIVVVGTGAGTEFEMSLRKQMGKRLWIGGTHLRARPFEEKALAVQIFARQVVPLLADGSVTPLVDRVFPFEEAAAAFDYLAAPGKLGKVLLRF